MPSLLRSAAVRAGTILVYCYGAVIAPTTHHAFHRDDHIHVGDSIIDLHGEHEGGEEHRGLADYDHGPDVQEVADDHDRHHHQHQHQHHDHAEHGSTSLWHFGAALSDHLDRTPALAVTGVVEWLRPSTKTHAPLLVARRTLRLRGPPDRRAS